MSLTFNSTNRMLLTLAFCRMDFLNIQDNTLLVWHFLGQLDEVAVDDEGEQLFA